MEKLRGSQEYKVLHIGDIAGVPQSLRDGLRERGYKSDVITFYKHPFDYGPDFAYDYKGSILKKVIMKVRKIYMLHSGYNVFHFHFASVLSYGVDLPLWKLLGKKVIFHYHGSDIRHKKQPFFHKWFVDKFIVSTPDLLNFVPKAFWLPNPFDVSAFVPVDKQLNKSPIRILHAPSNREIKGTEYIIKSIKEIKDMGYDIDFTLLENVTHNQVISSIKSSDIVIDWVNPEFGIYGVFSIEAMSIGKPVMCHIKEELVEKYGNLPILNTSPESLTDDLQFLIENDIYRNALGRRSREYVEQVHSTTKVIDKLINAYTS